MDFSNKDLKKLIGSEFKGYEVQREDLPSSLLRSKKRRLLNLIKSDTGTICLFDIDTKKFTARIDNDFDTGLEAVKDFRGRVLKMVTKKEADQKKQAEMDKASDELNKAFQNYFKIIKASEE